MCLVMAVTMQQGQILTTMVVVIAIEMVNLDEVIWQKVEFTVFTLTRLSPKQKRHQGTDARIRPEPRAPISPVSIEGRAVPFDLDM